MIMWSRPIIEVLCRQTLANINQNIDLFGLYLTRAHAHAYAHKEFQDIAETLLKSSQKKLKT